MASTVVAHVPHPLPTSTKHTRSSSPTTTTTRKWYRLDLPLRGSTRDAKAEVVKSRSGIFCPSGDSPKRRSSITSPKQFFPSSSNDHQSVASPGHVSFSDPGHTTHSPTLDCKYNAAFAYPSLSPQQEEARTSTSQPSPTRTQNSWHAEDADISDELADGQSAKRSSPLPVPPKSFPLQRSISILDSTDDSIGASLYRQSASYSYSASEPGHGFGYYSSHVSPSSSSYDHPHRRRTFSLHSFQTHNSSPAPFRLTRPHAQERRQQHTSILERILYPHARMDQPLSQTLYSSRSPDLISTSTPRPPRNKLRKSRGNPNSPTLGTRLIPATPLKQPPSILLKQGMIIDLTHSPPGIVSEQHSQRARASVTVSESGHSHGITDSPTPVRRPSNVTLYSSTSTSASCASGSAMSGYTSGSMNTSTAPTSPAATSEHGHRMSYPTYPTTYSSHSMPSHVSLSHHKSRSLGQVIDVPPTPSKPITPYQPLFPYQSPTFSTRNSTPSTPSKTSVNGRKLTKKRHPPPAPSTASRSRETSNSFARYPSSASAPASPEIKPSRSILGLRIGLGKGKEKERDMGNTKTSMERRSTESRYLPPVRSPSPLWARTEKLPNPHACATETVASVYSPFISHRTSSTSSPVSPFPSAFQAAQQARPTHHRKNASKALSDLAFTGATTALSSSALAELTSRLSAGEFSNESGGLRWEDGCDDELGFNPYHPTQRRDSVSGEEKSGIPGSRHHEKVEDKRGRSDVTRPVRNEATNGKDLTSRSSSIPFLDTDPYPPSYRHSHPRAQSFTHNIHTNPSHIPSRHPGVNLSQKKFREESPMTMNMRRWSLAMADADDEVLVAELEKLRQEGRERGRVRKQTVHSECSVEPRKRMTSMHGKDSGCDFVYGGPSQMRTQADTDRRAVMKGERERFHIGAGADEEPDEGSQYFDDDEGVFEDDASSVSSNSDADWKVARRALLCCRELIRTERTYLSQLRQLLSSDVAPTPTHPTIPTLIYQYVPALLRASEAFLAGLEDDPSAWGVSTAFIGCEEEFESAYVGWCGVVGDIFVDPSPGESSTSSSSHEEYKGRKLVRRHASVVSEDEARRRTGSDFGLKGRSKSGVLISQPTGHTSSPNPRRDTKQDRQRSISYYGQSSTTTPSVPRLPHQYSNSGSGMFTAALGTGLALGLSPPSSPVQHPLNPTRGSLEGGPSSPRLGGGPGTLSRTLTAWKRRGSFFSSSASLPAHGVGPPYDSVKHEKQKDRKKEQDRKGKKSTVRELAIQPTQRVMRYVLQYRDLLAHTPVSSPSRGLVERALESATKIAQKCDRAQGNSAFLRRQ